MKTEFTLKKAESKDSKYSSPMITMLSAVAGMLAFGGMICLCAVLLTRMSGGDVNAKFFTASFAVTIVGSVMFMLLSFLYRMGKKEYFKQRKEMYASARRLTGKVTGVTKYVRHVKYMKETFDETLWRFKITYEYGGEEKTAMSDKYLNDISKVLKSDKVSVLILSDGTTAFRNYQLRSTEEDPCIQLETEVIEQDAEV